MAEPKDGGKSRFQLDNLEQRSARSALVIVPIVRGDEGGGHDRRRESSKLEEAIGLARAIDLKIEHAGTVNLSKPKPGTLLGSGKVDEFKGLIAALDVGIVIVDHPLTPVQQRNLEEEWNAKVLDRTGLILEIFGARAQTKEGSLQVELAHLNYQKGRLVRTWTHLERQRGGLSFVGGPGETQIEADRRMLQERINKLEKELEKVRRTRSLHRSKRQKVPHPVVALVGYTNAGKSTLFNRITDSNVLVRDQLFATLDPTLRRLELPDGTLVIVSDTVGFVSGLPTHLIAAFRATLEEVVEADLILHVRDISEEDSDAQAADVMQVLEQLGVKTTDTDLILEVWNKIDALDSDALNSIRNQRKPDETGPVLVSALTGEGVEALLKTIERRVFGGHRVSRFSLGVGEMAALSWLYENGQVVDRAENKKGAVEVRVRLSDRQQGQFRSLFGDHAAV